MESSNSLDNIINQVENQAQEEINNICSSARQEIDAYKKEHEQRIKKFLHDQEKKFIRQGELKKRELITQEKLKRKKIILNKKREIIEDVIEGLVEQLKNLDKKKYQRFMNRLLTKVVDTKDEQILPGEQETVFTKNFLDKLNQDNKWNLSLGPKNSGIKDGFILKGKDYETVVDWASIKEFIREKEEDRIIKELFSATDG